ncbi:cardiolipin synthase [Saonia flava]|uniref:Cardiolipin synthase n=1 Tax=Saonia flava TaxID=523696 RepID=A0A846R2I1_9FLAO|nr:cardiolipin synthase [Saonia flava]NJB72155.1 cardiolipin synthase [Saonia flava]
MWLIIFLVLYIILAISIVLSLLIHGVKPAKTLGWLLAIFTIPVGGILLYLMIGRNRRKQKLYHSKKDEKLSSLHQNVSVENELYKRNKKIIHLIQRNTDHAPTLTNELTLLKDGKITFQSIFDDLEKAKDYIHLQYYIFEEGELANKLLELFKKKIAQNVKIRLIYDGIGSYSLSKSYLKKLKVIGVEAYPFLPFRFGRFLSSLNYRNHRKIIVIDDKIGFTGGINVSDKYLKGDPNLGTWHDMHLRIEGLAAWYLNRIFILDWYLATKQSIATKAPIIDPNKIHGKIVQIVPSGPDDDFSSIEQAYFSIITTAKEYVYITNPYIIPSQAILHALQTAALSGVDVRMLVSESADSTIVNWTVKSYFESFLKAGIKIFLYPDGFLHSKIVVSDNAIVSIGTANVDIRSFHQNYEVNAIVYNSDFAKKLKEDFLIDSGKSIELHYEVYTRRPWIHRLKEGAAKILSPIL